MTKLERIANSIVANIERGALREGDRLPSEEKLAERHAVSLGTVQKALATDSHSPGSFHGNTDAAHSSVVAGWPPLIFAMYDFRILKAET